MVDHFGQTYGVFLALSGKGFDYEELRRYALYMQKRLKKCTDVCEVTLFGIQPQKIVVELSRSRMAGLGIHPPGNRGKPQGSEPTDLCRKPQWP